MIISNCFSIDPAKRKAAREQFSAELREKVQPLKDLLNAETENIPLGLDSETIGRATAIQGRLNVPGNLEPTPDNTKLVVEMLLSGEKNQIERASNILDNWVEKDPETGEYDFSRTTQLIKAAGIDSDTCNKVSEVLLNRLITRVETDLIPLICGQKKFLQMTITGIEPGKLDSKQTKVWGAFHHEDGRKSPMNGSIINFEQLLRGPNDDYYNDFTPLMERIATQSNSYGEVKKFGPLISPNSKIAESIASHPKTNLTEKVLSFVRGVGKDTRVALCVAYRDDFIPTQEDWQLVKNGENNYFAIGLSLRDDCPYNNQSVNKV